MTYHFDTDIQAACQIATLGEIYEKYIGYKADGFFVEIGAFDGYSWSNTLPLIEAGWRGIMVEPDPANFALLSQRHGGNKKLLLVEAAIVLEDGYCRLYRGGANSTVTKEMIRIFKDTPGFGAILNGDNHVRVVGYKMDTMLEKYSCPKIYDVISIDVEGEEPNVLWSYNIDKHRPKLAIVEMDDQHPAWLLNDNARRINEYFSDHRYQRIYADRLNTIFLDSL